MTEQEILETNSMTSRCPTCHTPIRIGTPEQVVAYLERRGWRKIHDGDLAVWRFGIGHPDDCADVEVPMRGSTRDYSRRFLELVADLARIEGRSIPAIVDEMAPSVLDEMLAALAANASPVLDVEISQDLIDRLSSDGEDMAIDFERGVRAALAIVHARQAVLPDLQAPACRVALEEVATMLRGLLEHVSVQSPR